VFARWKAAVMSAALVAGTVTAVTAAVAPAGVASAAPVPQKLPSYESSACGAPVAGAVSCNAIELTSPTQYWRPSAPWKGDRPGRSGGGSSGGSAQTPAPPSSGYYPSDLLSAYGLAKAASAMTPGSSAPTVAIVDAYDDPNAASDLAAYRASMSGSTDPNTGLSDGTIPPLCGSGVTANCVTFTKVSQTGGTKYPTGNSGWAEEISLDLDMVSAICPDCNILLVEASSSSIANLATAEQEAESYHPVAIDNSYGGSEFSTETSYNSIYSSIAASSSSVGTAITAATGDDGYGTLFPAVSPLVTAVGGTSLSYTGTGSSLAWSAQSVWSDAGSGCSSYEQAPAWQQDQGVYRLSSDCPGRQVADVSADANPETGVATYDSYGESGWLVFGGTSVSTQIIGATYGLAAGTGTLKPSPQTLYPDSGATTGPTPGLVPVTSGDNTTSCGDYLCIAADGLSSGYNGPTGLGTPDGLTAFSSATTAPPPTSGSLSFSPTSEELTAGVASGSITVDLSTAAPSAGLSVTLSTSSTGGGFSTFSAGPFTATLTLPTISSNSSSSTPFYYEDTVAGSPTVTASASASGWGSAALPITVSAGPLKTINVAPSPVTLAEGGSQLFTASGVDSYGNSVSVTPSWSTTVPGGSMSPGSGTSSTLQTTNSGNGVVTATEGTVTGSATVTVTAESTLSVTVTAGSLSESRGRSYAIPLTVAADNATSKAGVSGASVALQIFSNATCSGTATASGTGTTASSGQVTFNFTTRTATTWCALATVTATGYSQGSGQTSFST
jgi:hypothetical protein